jgi:CO/xanthine dehydrogenase Mo-binding subunit
MRGHGGQQMAFAMDSILDMVAEEVGMDPVDIRLKNAIKEGERLPSDSHVRSCGFTECIEKARDRIDWREKHGKKNFRGVGIGCAPMVSGFSLGFRTGSSAFIKFNEDGEATLITGLIDGGQGNETMAVQIASEILGIPMENIRLICADTELTPSDPGNYAMSTTFVSGNAVKSAAEDAHRQIFEIVAEKFETSPENLELKDGKVQMKGIPERGMSIKDAVREGFRSKPVMGRGYYMPNLDFKRGWVIGKITGQRTGAYTFGAVTAEVEVDPETGTVRVLHAVGAQDVGFALNPMAVEGQNEGSLPLGQGQALYEKIHWDNGLMLNPNFLEYQPPLATDIPVMETVIVEPIDQDGPFGAKEATETTNIAIVPAILNAIYDATGVRIKDLPATPEKILKGLERKLRGEER